MDSKCDYVTEWGTYDEMGRPNPSVGNPSPFVHPDSEIESFLKHSDFASVAVRMGVSRDTIRCIVYSNPKLPRKTMKTALKNGAFHAKKTTLKSVETINRRWGILREFAIKRGAIVKDSNIMFWPMDTMSEEKSKHLTFLIRNKAIRLGIGYNTTGRLWSTSYTPWLDFNNQLAMMKCK